LETPDYIRSQYDGLKVFIDQIGEKYNLIIFNDETNQIITALKDISYKRISKLGKNYGWSI